MNDLVSVIIPTYNRSQFVTEAIDSVLRQTYPNIELIVVNDGSTDDTEQRLQPYLDNIIYRWQENQGPGPAVNTGLRIAKGKYITRLDDDDLFTPDKIEKQVKVFEENPDVGLVTSGCFITDSIGRIISVHKAPDFSEYGPFLSLILDYNLYQPTVMVRRECHDHAKVGLYRNTYAQEYNIFLRISRYWKVWVIDQPLALHRRHSGNRTVDSHKNEELKRDISGFICDVLADISLEELFPAIRSTSLPYRRSCAYAARGALYLRHRVTDKADADFSKALELCPTNPIPLVWLGLSARFRKDFQLAKEYFSKIQESDELYSIARDARDLIPAIQNDRDEGSPLLRKETVKERRKLFRITFDGISGKALGKVSPPSLCTEGLELSKYAVIVDDYPRKGRHIAFNTFTHAMVNIEDDFRDALSDADSSFSPKLLENAGLLKKMGILASSEADETQRIRRWYEKAKSDMSMMQATILTTYDCNFACKYCIEEGIKRNIYMDDQCADAVADWLMNGAKENGTDRITLFFYGGEPLLNTGPIYRISEKLQKFAVENEILLSSYITTNGSMLDGKMLEYLTGCGLRAVKVTIDGAQAVHDSRRPFKSGRGSFDLIVEKIRKMPETVKLIIQSNLDEENMDAFPSLLDFFEESGLKDRIDSLTVSPVMRSLGALHAPVAQETGCPELSESYMADDLVHAEKLIIERGFRSRDDNIGYTICSMDREGSIILVDPLGDIYNCAAFVGRREFSIGSIREAELERNTHVPADQLEECFQCTYFPVCGGGCRYKAHILYGDHNRIFCEKEAIENRARELIKLRHDQRVEQMANA